MFLRRFLTIQRFSSYLDTFEIAPAEDVTGTPESDACLILSVPISALEQICYFLESCSLRALASTCSEMRETLFVDFAHRGTVSLRWKKGDGHWVAVTKVGFLQLPSSVTPKIYHVIVPCRCGPFR